MPGGPTRAATLGMKATVCAHHWPEARDFGLAAIMLLPGGYYCVSPDGAGDAGGSGDDYRGETVGSARANESASFVTEQVIEHGHERKEEHSKQRHH
jgi:hypothetical protein